MNGNLAEVETWQKLEFSIPSGDLVIDTSKIGDISFSVVPSLLSIIQNTLH